MFANLSLNEGLQRYFTISRRSNEIEVLPRIGIINILLLLVAYHNRLFLFGLVNLIYTFPFSSMTGNSVRSPDFRHSGDCSVHAASFFHDVMCSSFPVKIFVLVAMHIANNIIPFKLSF